MKTRITVMFLLLTTLVQAQDNYMSLSFGLGNPLADYANNKSLEDHGFALKGFMAEYSAAYYVQDHIGFVGSIKFNQNTVDKPAVTKELLALLPSDPENETLKLDIGYWSIVSFAVGPQFTLPFGTRFNFDIYVMPGLHIVTPPKMNLFAVIDEEPNSINLSSQKVRFGFEAGLSLRIKLNESTGLRIFASYLQTSSKGEILQKIESEVKENASTDFSKTIQLIDTGIGIVYRM